MDGPVLRPRPKRPFSLASTPDTNYPSRPSSPVPNEVPESPNLAVPQAEEPTSPPSRTRSILNLTSSTLFGIYSHSDYAPDRDDTTPFGTGAETPLESRSSRGSTRIDAAGLGLDAAAWQQKSQRRRSIMLDTSTHQTEQKDRERSRGRGKRRKSLVPAMIRSLALGAVGVCYGLLISQLHERQQIAPVRVDGIPHRSRAYLAFWGVVAIILGNTMPYVDHLWEITSDEEQTEGREGTKSSSSGGKGVGKRGGAPEWNDIVRSIGAFVGVAFAIRKLPWQSTLQLSLTLALSNPFIWFLLDRTPPGLVFSSTVALSGTALCLAVNPDIIPAPSARTSLRPGLGAVPIAGGSQDLVLGVFSHESVGVATWIASVLFFSAVCFGNIGRRL